ncbi:sensor histidine kinase [Roseobacter sp. A03A-229]
MNDEASKPEGRHYLQSELYDLVSKDPDIWDFLQKGSLDGVWYWNLERPQDEWMSPEFWQLLGIEPSSKSHNPAEWQDIIFEDDLAVALENFDKHCADPTHPYNQVVRYKHADGSTVWVRCRGVAIRDKNGTPVRMLGAHNDLTEVKNAEAVSRKVSSDLAKIQQDEILEVERTNGRLRAFAYGLAHDLKSPAKNVSFLVDELSNSLGGKLDAEETELFKHVQANQRRLVTMLERVLQYSMAMEKRSGEDSVDCNLLLQEVQNDCETQILAARATINYHDLPTLRGDRQQLKSLFENLLLNSLKYAQDDEPAEITLASEVSQTTVFLEFSDNGIGIAPKDREFVFEAFKRLHRSDDIEGTGLGLSICRQIVENHGGSITAASNRDRRGTTFHIELPLEA